MGMQTAAEIRKEVLDDDSRRDVSIYVSVPVGVMAGISAAGAVCAVICVRALIYFREDVDAYWLSCVPFLFPVITGLFAAYKKQFSLLGVHMTTTLLALLMGGFGFGLAVEPVFLNRDNCVRAMPDIPCTKDALSYLFVVSGSVAAAFAGLGFLLTLCALNSATKRLAHRRHEEDLEHLREQEAKQQELRQKKMTRTDIKPSVFSVTSSDNSTANGKAQVPQGNAGKDGADVTTKL